MTAVTVPQLSISMEDAKVSRWLVEDGAEVAAGQLVVEVETDKATVEIEAPGDGRLRIVAAEGEIVAVEGVLGGGRAGRRRSPLPPSPPCLRRLAAAEPPARQRLPLSAAAPGRGPRRLPGGAPARA